MHFEFLSVFDIFVSVNQPFLFRFSPTKKLGELQCVVSLEDWGPVNTQAISSNQLSSQVSLLLTTIFVLFPWKISFFRIKLHIKYESSSHKMLKSSGSKIY